MDQGEGVTEYLLMHAIGKALGRRYGGIHGLLLRLLRRSFCRLSPRRARPLAIRPRQKDGVINEENRPTIHLVYNYGCSLGMRHKRLAMIILPLTLNTCPAELQRTKDGAIATTEQRWR
jgi:hypothetical protein